MEGAASWLPLLHYEVVTTHRKTRGWLDLLPERVQYSHALKREMPRKTMIHRHLGLAVGPQTSTIEGFREYRRRPPAGDPVRQRLTDSGMLPLCAVSSKYRLGR